MKKRLMAALIGVSAFFATSAAADTCGGTYTVRSGDSLSLIADRLYKDVGKWSAIHSRNIDVIPPLYKILVLSGNVIFPLKW